MWCSVCPLNRYLTIDIPRTPLFKDSQGGNIIPQIPLYNVLEKFNGQHVTVCSLTHPPTFSSSRFPCVSSFSSACPVIRLTNPHGNPLLSPFCPLQYDRTS
jgi:hypothetical protein